MDLFSLDAAPAVLIKSQQTIKYSKVDPDKLRETLQSQTQGKDLVTAGDLNSKLTVNTDGPKALEEMHGATIFFESQLDVKPNAQGQIIVNKVGFSEDDFNRCHDLVQSVRGMLKSKAFLDYDDYAKQALCSNVVSTFAKNNLNEEQAQVLNAAMDDYIQSQQIFAKFNSEKAKNSSFDGIKDYYGKTDVISSQQADYINASFNKIGLNSKVKAGTQTVLPQATNEDLLNTIQSLFSQVDLNDSEQLNQALSSYQALLKPVYGTLNYGISDQELNTLVQSKSDDLLKMVQTYRHYTSTSISDYA